MDMTVLNRVSWQLKIWINNILILIAYPEWIFEIRVLYVQKFPPISRLLFIHGNSVPGNIGEDIKEEVNFPN